MRRTATVIETPGKSSLATPVSVTGVVSPSAGLRQTEVFPQNPVSRVEEKVLILDGNTRSALAATRSLGRKGVHVVAADDNKWNLSGYSAYCRETFTYPSPVKNPVAFVTAVRSEAERRGIGVLFPMSEISTATILKYREALAKFSLPFVDFPTFEQLTDRRKLLAIARELNVKVPETRQVNDAKALEAMYPDLQFPVVVRPLGSRIFSKGRWISAPVRYAHSIPELEKTIAQNECFREHPFMIQRYIAGYGHGIFALYDRGQALAFFAHRRLREKPASGGVSVLCESVAPIPEALRMAKALLDHVNWHGVAMVEFKVSESGVPFLMEVNGRFWGSLQLAIDAGMDFPWLLYRLALGKDLGALRGYQVGVRTRWLLGDLASVYGSVMGNGGEGSPIGGPQANAILQFVKSFRMSSRNDVCRMDDPKPFLVEISQFLAKCQSRIIRFHR